MFGNYPKKYMKMEKKWEKNGLEQEKETEKSQFGVEPKIKIHPETIMWQKYDLICWNCIYFGKII